MNLYVLPKFFFSIFKTFSDVINILIILILIWLNCSFFWVENSMIWFIWQSMLKLMVIIILHKSFISKWMLTLLIMLIILAKISHPCAEAQWFRYIDKGSIAEKSCEEQNLYCFSVTIAKTCNEQVAVKLRNRALR